MKTPNLKTNIGELELKNPVITASGTCGYGEELKKFINPNILGAITVKGVTVEPTSGNPTPRIAETPSGLLNSIGLENPGIENFIEEKIELFQDFDLPIIVNISGHSLNDFKILAQKLETVSEVSALEVNVSCPNLEGGGMAFGTDKKLVYEVTKIVKENFSRTVITKLSPNVTDIVEMAKSSEKAGADAISLINTLLGMKIDVEQQKPVLGNVWGGLSGPAVKPVALRMVYQVYREVNIPLIGIGGIMKSEDALEFILAGASGIGVGTATLIEPAASKNILNGLKKYLKNNEIKNIADLRGKAQIERW